MEKKTYDNNNDLSGEVFSGRESGGKKSARRGTTDHESAEEKSTGRVANDHLSSGEEPGTIDKRENRRDGTRVREAPVLFMKGFVMGSADVVPGVSGGTMALILGIYGRLIFAIKSADLSFFRFFFRLQWSEAFDGLHWKFLFSVLAGAAAAILFFTKVVALPVLMHTHPEWVYGLFFGLISGSIVMLLRSVEQLGWREGMTVIIGTLIGFRVVTLVPADTPEHALFVFISGSLAITAMVLPGISGSFILLILRKYDYILGNIALLGTERTLEAVWVLMPFGLGMLAGLALFVRVLSWLLKRYEVVTLCVLIGFMTGSLYVIWPFQERVYMERVRTEVVHVEDPMARLLLGREPDRQRPEYSEAGPVLNPGDPVSEQQVEIRHVRRRLVRTSPFLPDFIHPEEDTRLLQGRSSLYGGLFMLTAGFIAVLLIAVRAGGLHLQKPGDRE